MASELELAWVLELGVDEITEVDTDDDETGVELLTAELVEATTELALLGATLLDLLLLDSVAIELALLLVEKEELLTAGWLETGILLDDSGTGAITVLDS